MHAYHNAPLLSDNSPHIKLEELSNLVSSVIINQKFYNTKEPCSYMTHGEEEAQTKEERKDEDKSHVPLMTSGIFLLLIAQGNY